ncbi:hypothetical protein [Neosynechococcus sphagnicola]|uniref:hypothetical protein n=1 Tax=Neosynechococcus sphagnicola TaxID=1501145 RepID=UPI000561DF30|nr:hypothetical protein [Neosynechococcus sphagnicola]
MTQLATLNQQLYKQIDQAWTIRPSFQTDLIFRVDVTSTGAIAHLEPTNSAATDYLQETPLPTLAQNPTAATSQEPLAPFKVVFTPKGVLQVSPWRGFGTSGLPSP